MNVVDHLTQATYLAAAALFIFSLRWLSTPKTARQGVAAGVAGMTLAIIGTLMHPEIVSYRWIVIALVVGTAIGVPLSWVPLTAVPQRTALSHAFGGLAAGLVGTAKYMLWLQDGELTAFRTFAIVVEVLLGYLTFTGSLMAAGKLQEVLPTRPITYKNQNVINLLLLAIAIVSGLYLVARPETWQLFPIVVVLSLLFGVLLILPIGGADMPTVISLLNSYAGLSAVAMGFVLENKVLITAGALDGSSGFILSVIMCKAMNRSFTNVLFGAFGQVTQVQAAAEARAVKSATPRDVADILENASRVVVIPGYGMAVAQAQHRVRELYDQLSKRGIDVPLRDSPGGGPHARAHERAAGRGGGPVHGALGDGRHQPGHAAGGRRDRRRRQRRRQPGGAARQDEPDLRHADHQRRQGEDRHRNQAVDEPRLRGHRERAVLRRQLPDGLRRREGRARRHRQGAER